MPTRSKSNSALSRLTRLGGPQTGTVAALALGQSGSNLTIFAGTPVGIFRSVGLDGKTLEKWERLAAAPIGVIALAISPNYAEDHMLVAGTNTGIFLSRDSGQTWTTAHMPISGSTAATINFSPNYPANGILLAGTLEDGVLASETRGENWSNKSFGLLDTTIYALAFSPNFAQDGIVYAGTDTTVYHSYNRALAWKQLDFPDDAAPVLSLALSPNFKDDQTLYVGTETRGLFRSTDRGANWQPLDLPATCVNALLFHQTAHQASHQALIAATEAGVFQSLDNGETWKNLLSDVGSATANAISLGSLAGLLVAGLAEQGMQLTNDLVNWTMAPNLAASSLLGLALSPQFEHDPIAYMFGPQAGLWQTSDGGQTWATLSENLPSSDITGLALSPAFSENHNLVAASPEGLWISQDSGQHWERVATAPTTLVSFSPNGRMLTAYFQEGGVGVTEDLGQTWTHVRGPWDGAGKVVALSVSNAQHYYVAWLEGIGETLSLWQGKRGEFEKVLSQPVGKNPVISFFVPPEPAPDRPWYASLENHVWKFSGRRGRSPIKLTVFANDKQVESILALTGTEGLLLASTGRRLFKSLDGSSPKSWTLVHDFHGERAVALSLSPTFTKDKTLYLLLLGGAFSRMIMP